MLGLLSNAVTNRLSATPWPTNSHPTNRRYQIALAAAAGAFSGGIAIATSGLLPASEGAVAAEDNLPPHVPSRMKEQGAPILSRPYGQPSPLRAPTPTQTASLSMTPLQDLHGIITPNGLNFEGHHAGVPVIDPDRGK